jgi:hypothetical protein
MRASRCRSLPALLCLAAATAASPGRAAAEPRSDEGQASLPFASWARLLERSRQAPRPAPELPLGTISRSLQGEVRDGLLRATLRWRFVVLPGQSLRVPLLRGQASVSSARLDGRAVSLVRSEDELAVEAPRPGPHELALGLLLRASQEGFEQRLQLKLAPGASTQLSIGIDQQPVTASLAVGALGTEARAGHTLLRGDLDSTGLLDLRWSGRRRVEPQAARLSGRLLGLLTVGESAVHGLALYELGVEAGAVEHLDLLLPPGVEVLKTSGASVLQWQVAPGPQRRLRVLFRQPVDRSTRFQVSYQAAAAGTGERQDLPLLLPGPVVTVRASVGIQAPKSLEVKLERRQGARLLPPAEWPPELVELTRNPLLHVLELDGPASLAVRLSRRPRLGLTSAIVDELHAATVLLPDGTELTKLRLQIRNNTRQHLQLRVPPGATLLRAFVDGQPVRPGMVPSDPGLLLLPLRQSQRVDGTHLHRVADGETLAEIANLYFSDPGQWPLILKANRLSDPRTVQAGQQLRIPRGPQVTVEESAFALELAYRQGGTALGLLGRRRLALPELDLEVMRLYWHLFLPPDQHPVHFAGDLTQQTLVRFDLFRRARELLRRALQVRSAWAEPGNILARRRALYLEEAGSARHEADDDPLLFPLVGERYRFHSLLVGRHTPRLTVSYLQLGLLDVARLGALLLCAVCTFLSLRRSAPPLPGLRRSAPPLPGLRSRRWWSCGLALAGLLPLLLLGFYVPGVYRRMVWGACLGVVIALVQLERGRPWPRLRQLWLTPWSLLVEVRPRDLLAPIGLAALAMALVSFPLLLSTGLLAGLLVAWARRRRRPPEEVHDVA